MKEPLYHNFKDIIERGTKSDYKSWKRGFWAGVGLCFFIALVLFAGQH